MEHIGPPNNSFKNWIGPPVEPEKTGTEACVGFFSALDRLRL
jgi:hypothetical protein